MSLCETAPLGKINGYFQNPNLADETAHICVVSTLRTQEGLLFLQQHFGPTRVLERLSQDYQSRGLMFVGCQ